MSAATVKGSQRNLFRHRHGSLSRLAWLCATRRGRSCRGRGLHASIALLSIQVHRGTRHAFNRTDIIRHWINPYFEPRLTAPPAFFAILYCSCPSPQLIRIGQGPALIKRSTKVSNLIRELLKQNNYKVSIKLRLGLNEIELKQRKIFTLLKELGKIAKENSNFYVLKGPCLLAGKELT